MIVTGNCSIPASMRETIEGEFKLKTEDGTEVGRLATKDGRGWGLAPFLRKSGGEPGDTILLTIDLQAKEVVINFCEQADNEQSE